MNNKELIRILGELMNYFDCIFKSNLIYEIYFLAKELFLKKIGRIEELIGYCLTRDEYVKEYTKFGFSSQEARIRSFFESLKSRLETLVETDSLRNNRSDVQKNLIFSFILIESLGIVLSADLEKLFESFLRFNPPEERDLTDLIKFKKILEIYINPFKFFIKKENIT